MPAFPLVIVVSVLSSIVKDQVGFLKNLGFEVAFIGESEKLDNDIIEGNIKLNCVNVPQWNFALNPRTCTACSHLEIQIIRLESPLQQMHLEWESLLRFCIM